MKPVWLSKVLFLAAISLAVVSCDKKTSTIDDTPIVAGKGGKAWLTVIPRHDNRDFDSCIVYIKYNTLDKPKQYDDSMLTVLVDGRYRAVFTDLHQGNYFVYAKGWDNERSQIVAGGYQFTVKTETSKDVLELPVFVQ